MGKLNKRVNRFILVIGIILISFVLILSSCSFTISMVKESQKESIQEMRKRDFQSIWGALLVVNGQAEKQTSDVAKAIELQIKNHFDLNELKEGLDNNDARYTDAVYQIIRNNMENVHLNGVDNNRNSMIVLEGYDTIIEDFFVDPDSREKELSIDEGEQLHLSSYRDTTYNTELFDISMRRLRNHTTDIIAIEPYNYIHGDHRKIDSLSYEAFEELYVEEGFDGFRNYQFMVPVYITDTGDIFGQQDVVNGIKQETHKFTVITTFNLYDQLSSFKEDIGDDDCIRNIVNRYSRILNSLYILGLIVCAIIILIILYSVYIYNCIIDLNKDLLDALDENRDKDDLENNRET